MTRNHKDHSALSIAYISLEYCIEMCYIYVIHFRFEWTPKMSNQFLSIYLSS